LVKSILTRKFKMFVNEKLPLKTNIPSFHYSMCDAKSTFLDKPFYFPLFGGI